MEDQVASFLGDSRYTGYLSAYSVLSQKRRDSIVVWLLGEFLQLLLMYI